jgi:hypothetical protein
MLRGFAIKTNRETEKIVLDFDGGANGRGVKQSQNRGEDFKSLKNYWKL